MIRALAVSNLALSDAASGLIAVTVTIPAMKAATAAGLMKRQAESPAARIATSWLERLRP